MAERTYQSVRWVNSDGGGRPRAGPTVVVCDGRGGDIWNLLENVPRASASQVGVEKWRSVMVCNVGNEM